MTTLEAVNGLCTACGRISPAGLTHCGYCGKAFSPSPLNGRPIAEAMPFGGSRPRELGATVPSNVQRVTCRSCGSVQPPDHIHCSACGMRIAPKVVGSNRTSYKRTGLPLFHSRLVIRSDRPGTEPKHRTWGDRVARLYFNVSLVVLLGLVVLRSGWIPESVTDGLHEHLARLPSLPFTMPSLALPGTRPAEESAGSPATPTQRTGESQPGLQPSIIGRGDPVAQPGKDVQLLPYRLERAGDHLVAIGEIQNVSENSAANIVVTFTFTSATGSVIDVGKDEVGLLEPGQKRAWKVAVPYRSSVTSGGINVEWLTRPPR
jgi:hypothetical protein